MFCTNSEPHPACQFFLPYLVLPSVAFTISHFFDKYSGPLPVPCISMYVLPLPHLILRYMLASAHHISSIFLFSSSFFTFSNELYHYCIFLVLLDGATPSRSLLPTNQHPTIDSRHPSFLLIAFSSSFLSLPSFFVASSFLPLLWNFHACILITRRTFSPRVSPLSYPVFLAVLDLVLVQDFLFHSFSQLLPTLIHLILVQTSTSPHFFCVCSPCLSFLEETILSPSLFHLGTFVHLPLTLVPVA